MNKIAIAILLTITCTKSFADDCEYTVLHNAKGERPTAECLSYMTTKSIKLETKTTPRMLIFAYQNFILVHKNVSNYYWANKPQMVLTKFRPTEIILFAGENIPLRYPDKIEYDDSKKEILITDGRKRYVYSLSSGGGNIKPDRTEDAPQ